MHSSCSAHTHTYIYIYFFFLLFFSFFFFSSNSSRCSTLNLKCSSNATPAVPHHSTPNLLSNLKSSNMYPSTSVPLNATPSSIVLPNVISTILTQKFNEKTKNQKKTKTKTKNPPGNKKPIRLSQLSGVSHASSSIIDSQPYTSI